MSMKDVTAKNLLKSLSAISAGHPLRGSVDSLPPGDVVVVQMRDVIGAHSIDWNSAAKVELPTKKEPDWLQDGDILLSTRGTNNYAVLVSDPPIQSVAAPSFFVLRIKKRKDILPGFLCWQLNQAPARLYFERAATGSYILNLRRSAVEELPVAVPPIRQQQLISELFRMFLEEREALEKLIENRERQMGALASGLFQSAGVS